MGTFRQFGDPVCPDCLCQHHAEAYGEEIAVDYEYPANIKYNTYDDGMTVIATPITITERCCVATNTAVMLEVSGILNAFELERPLGTKRVDQETEIVSGWVSLYHKASWEVLDPGTYTYYLVARAGGYFMMHGAWMKIIASDCEG